jgi:hypothetical protein
MKHYVVIERTDKHGSPDGSPRLQPITGKGEGLDLAWFAAQSPGGVHLWRFTDEAAANTFFHTRVTEGVQAIGTR